MGGPLKVDSAFPYRAGDRVSPLLAETLNWSLLTTTYRFSQPVGDTHSKENGGGGGAALF